MHHLHTTFIASYMHLKLGKVALVRNAMDKVRELATFSGYSAKRHLPLTEVIEKSISDHEVPVRKPKSLKQLNPT